MSASPFRIEGPAVVSFSGGRTSGYMLRRILDEGLQPDVHVLFADTGKERRETYDFVRACSTRWGVPICWVTRGDEREPWARRPGEPTPFELLLRERGYLPTPTMRLCTQELKVRPMKAWMLGRGYEHWTNVVGIRADEPHRVARMRAPNKERWDVALPLADAGVTEREVLDFWGRQAFDLQLRTWEGNCDLCFLKSAAKLKRIMRDRPDLAPWWVEQEQRARQTFRLDRPDYAALLRSSDAQGEMFADPELDALSDCICHEGTGP
jgi:3'-phosphoadenosine 5'-phosphosulfate sulfotransferase (PAPS reductase)/FAD synthetase